MKNEAYRIFLRSCTKIENEMKNEIEILFNLMMQWRFWNYEEVHQNDVVSRRGNGMFSLANEGGKQLIQTAKQTWRSNKLFFQKTNKNIVVFIPKPPEIKIHESPWKFTSR